MPTADAQPCLYCSRAPETRAVARCRACGEPVCERCGVFKGGVAHCQACTLKLQKRDKNAAKPRPLTATEIRLEERRHRVRWIYRKIFFWRVLNHSVYLFLLAVLLTPVVIALAVVGSLQFASNYYLQEDNRQQRWAASVVFAAADLDYFILRYRHCQDVLVRALDAFPDDSRCPDASLRVALCLDKLGNDAQARRWLNLTIARYPGTAAAAGAKRRLDMY